MFRNRKFLLIQTVLLTLVIGTLSPACGDDEEEIVEDFAGHTLTYDSCWFPILRAGILTSMHLIYTDPASPGGVAKLYFELDGCSPVPEVDQTYAIPGGGGTCAFSGATLYFLQDDNGRGYSGETWQGTGEITFETAEIDDAAGTVHLAGTYTLTFTDAEGVEQGTLTLPFDGTDSL